MLLLVHCSFFLIFLLNTMSAASCHQFRGGKNTISDIHTGWHEHNIYMSCFECSFGSSVISGWPCVIVSVCQNTPAVISSWNYATVENSESFLFLGCIWEVMFRRETGCCLYLFLLTWKSAWAYKRYVHRKHDAHFVFFKFLHFDDSDGLMVSCFIFLCRYLRNTQFWFYDWPI